RHAWEAETALIRGQIEEVDSGIDRGTAGQQRVRACRPAIEAQRPNDWIGTDEVAGARHDDRAGRAYLPDERIEGIDPECRERSRVGRDVGGVVAAVGH